MICIALVAGTALGCGKTDTEVTVAKEETTDELTVIPELKIAIAPYSDADTIVTATKPLGELIQETIKQYGYEIEDISITVGTSYDIVGEALDAGTADLGFISGATYVLYEDGCDVLLTALRKAIDKDSTDPADWNNGALESFIDTDSKYYRSIIITGPSEKGQAILEKEEAGEEITWEDLDACTWSVMSASSASGYIYPSLWLEDHYQKGISELSHVIQSDSYSTSMARLASGEADIMVSFGHIRLNNADKWMNDFGGTAPIEEQTGIIGVSEPIYNDTISVSSNSEIMDNEFRQAIGQTFIDIGNTEEGKEIISVFSQIGYEWADDANYDGERKAQELLKSLQ